MKPYKLLILFEDSRLLGEVHIALLKLIIKDIEDIVRTPSGGPETNQYTVANLEGGHPQIVKGMHSNAFPCLKWTRYKGTLIDDVSCIFEVVCRYTLEDLPKAKECLSLVVAMGSGHLCLSKGSFSGTLSRFECRILVMMEASLDIKFLQGNQESFQDVGFRSGLMKRIMKKNQLETYDTITQTLASQTKRGGMYFSLELQIHSAPFINLVGPNVTWNRTYIRMFMMIVEEVTHRVDLICYCSSKLKNLRHLDIRGTPELKDTPLGIGELKSLQTLSKIVIGGENDFSINQLKDLNNLRGEISFKGLDNVLNIMEVRAASLSLKRITVLKVEWDDESDDGSREQIARKEVLDALKPYDDTLKKLVIMNYLGLGFLKWVRDPSFRQLARVSIRGCKKCTSLPPLGKLQSLKELSIQDMDDVKVVGSVFFGTGLAFPSVEILSFQNMSRWEVWSISNSRSGVRDSVFPCLKRLDIEGCPNLFDFSFERDEVFTCLQELCIRDCPNLAEVSLKAPLLSLRDLTVSKCGDGLLSSLVHAGPSITKLNIYYISGLTNEVWKGIILDLKAVEELEIMCCNEIRYLWESKEAEASSKILVNLRKLQLWECENLVSLEGGGQKLKSVTIGVCNKLSLLNEELGERREKNRLLIRSKSVPMLEHVWIQDCKSMGESHLPPIEESYLVNYFGNVELSRYGCCNWALASPLAKTQKYARG
nr:hypothetical protein [Tanacetum cinerariifolium]